jgi:hypothetical protein
MAHYLGQEIYGFRLLPGISMISVEGEIDIKYASVLDCIKYYDLVVVLLIW